MPSHLSWIDFSTKERNQMLNVVRLFEESDSRDELGIGTIRDTISEYFFPGTSTIQTRARYFLFVPWMYLLLERKQVKSSDIEKRARKEETDLISILKKKGEREGLIGDIAGNSLKRLPSNIYWNGLGIWGIRLFPGNQWQYHRSVDSYYRRIHAIMKGEDGDTMSAQIKHNWHPGIPDSPSNFPYSVEGFALTKEEAEYLRDRVMTRHEKSLLSYFLAEQNCVRSRYTWSQPLILELPKEMQEKIGMARSFAEVINGAALLYNLILAELRNSEQQIEEYNVRIDKWTQMIDTRIDTIREWSIDLERFWHSPLCDYGNIHPRTKTFVERWVDLAINENGYKAIHTHGVPGQKARDLISSRERRLKGPKSRIHNQRALELWSGAAGTNMLDYRWSTVNIIIQDIIEGLKR